MNGRVVHGLLHPEFGHMRIPHDRARDPFDGICPDHGDCLEGLASGEAIRQRWGRPGQELSGSAVWEIEAEYLALALVNVVCLLSPQRIIIGGGGRSSQRCCRWCAGGCASCWRLPRAPSSPIRPATDGYVVPPQLGSPLASSARSSSRGMRSATAEAQPSRRTAVAASSARDETPSLRKMLVR